MGTNKPYRIQDKTGKPLNVVQHEHQLIDESERYESLLPPWTMDYCIFIKNAVSHATRVAYLRDLHYFFQYLISQCILTGCELPRQIPLESVQQLTARDVNYYLDYLTRYRTELNGQQVVLENHARSLSRKRSALSVFFKYLYRTEMIPANIIDGFNPIKLPKPQPDAIKRLDVDEVTQLLRNVMSGEGLTERERTYWQKTKYRDRAILALFITYGLRLKELQQLNISSFNFTRSEFRIFRKRGKEVLMPINKTCEDVVREYIRLERQPGPDADSQDALFLSLQKTRMTERAIRELVKKYSSIVMETDRRGGYSPHKLRATAATSLIEYGFSIYDVQNLMDHDNVTTTQLYSAHRRHAKRDLLKQYELRDRFDKNPGKTEE